MKIREGFVIRELADQWVVIATGEASKHFVGMITLNKTGKEIWEGIQSGKREEEIVEQLASVYEVSKEEIAQDVREMIQQMKEAGFFES